MPYTGLYDGSDSDSFSANVVIQVVITTKVPNLKLKSGTFTLNDYLYDVKTGATDTTPAEIASTTYV